MDSLKYSRNVIITIITIIRPLCVRYENNNKNIKKYSGIGGTYVQDGGFNASHTLVFFAVNAYYAYYSDVSVVDCYRRRYCRILV